MQKNVEAYYASECEEAVIEYAKVLEVNLIYFQNFYVAINLSFIHFSNDCKNHSYMKNT